MKGRCLGLLLLVISVPRCIASRPASEVPSRHGKSGATQIGEIYSLTGAHPMIGFLDPRDHSVYVAEPEAARVKAALRVREEKGNAWVVGHPSLEGEYTVRPIATLDLTQAPFEGMAAVNKNSTCTRFVSGTCINMYDSEDNFSYSWKAPEDIFLCKWTEAQDCTDIWKKRTVDTYQQQDCQGPATSREEEISFCNPV